jgi:hypothetical protein
MPHVLQRIELRRILYQADARNEPLKRLHPRFDGDISQRLDVERDFGWRLISVRIRHGANPAG